MVPPTNIPTRKPLVTTALNVELKIIRKAINIRYEEEIFRGFFFEENSCLYNQASN
jgi:hypothetical protein